MEGEYNLENVNAGRDIVFGNKETHHHFNEKNKNRLACLFEKLNGEFDNSEEISGWIDDLNRYIIPRDVIGFEQKMTDGNREDLIEDALWLKEEYYKKLSKYQLYQSAQKIQAQLLASILEKFRNNITPLIRDNADNITISNAISTQIVNPIMVLLEQEGVEDNLLGFSATDIEGMIYYLTGRCHIKWN
jgi:uncharacterized membrane protein YheB (UPF0754 family)